MNARVQTEELRFKESRKMARNLIMNSPMMKSKPESVLHQARILALQVSDHSKEFVFSFANMASNF